MNDTTDTRAGDMQESAKGETPGSSFVAIEPTPTPETDAAQLQVENSIGGKSTVVSFLVCRHLERRLITALQTLNLAERELTARRPFHNGETAVLQRVRQVISELQGRPF